MKLIKVYDKAAVEDYCKATIGPILRKESYRTYGQGWRITADSHTGRGKMFGGKGRVEDSNSVYLHIHDEKAVTLILLKFGLESN